MGYLVGIAVSADRQGRGYGAAITTTLTRALLTEFDVCALGVVDHNVKAREFFEQVGYRDWLALSMIRL